MAPYPEEIDVFSAPHSRMKALVDVYSEKLMCTDFSDYVALESLLQELHHTFCEFKSHEQIENKYIMRKLKNRLKVLQMEDAAVCNCHSDNKLQDMLSLVAAGRTCVEEGERKEFGGRLSKALHDFNDSFLPHMKEEEEVFQPMLMKYFEYEELKCLKERVIEEHSKWSEKNVIEDAQADRKVDAGGCGAVGVKRVDIPPEVLQHIMSFLPRKDLVRCSSVCKQWKSISRMPGLWRDIYPCQWAHGVWENDSDASHEERVAILYPGAAYPALKRDEDADVEEEEDDHRDEAVSMEGMVRGLLPHIGPGVHKIVLASSRALNSTMLRSMLSLCPNVVHLDVSYTTVLDAAFKGVRCLRLRHLNLSGCRNVTDEGLYRLAGAMVPPMADCEIEESGLWLKQACGGNAFCESVCMWQRDGLMCHLAKLSLQCPLVYRPSLSYLNLSGCSEVSDDGLGYLYEAGVLRELEFLDVSGCWLMSGQSLCYITSTLPLLRAENISYCDQILDGPYPQTANGCQNLESGLRHCCRFR